MTKVTASKERVKFRTIAIMSTLYQKGGGNLVFVQIQLAFASA